MLSTIGLLCFVLLFTTASGLNTVEKRCRAPQHITCKFLSQKLEMWCDETNLTNIPDPATFNSFADAIHAKTMFMNHSCLQGINVGILKKYTCLTQLDFDDNRITTLPPSPFSNCRKLKRLKLSRNQLQTINPGVFTGLKGLKELRLNHNRIESLKSKTFLELVELQVLTLNNNRLERIPKNLFLDLLKLVHLDLSQNRLQVLGIYDLRGIPQLRTLSLEGNGIEKIHENSIPNCPKLQTVDLRHNNLSCLHHGLFKDSNMSKIFMNGNNLRTPKPDWFRSLTRNNPQAEGWDDEPAMNKNQWNCDCDAIPYWRFLREEIKDLEVWVRRLDIKCSEPEFFAGQMLSTISSKNIHRQHNKSCNVWSSKSLDCGATPTKRTPSTDLPTTTRLKTTTASIFIPATAEKQVDTFEISLWLPILFVGLLLLVVAVVVMIGCKYVHCVRRKDEKSSSQFVDTRTNRSDDSFSSPDSEISATPSGVYDQVYLPRTSNSSSRSNPPSAGRQNSSDTVATVHSLPTHVPMIPNPQYNPNIHYACMAPGTAESINGYSESVASGQHHQYHSIASVRGSQPNLYLSSSCVNCQRYFNVPASGFPPAPVLSERQDSNASSTHV